MSKYKTIECEGQFYRFYFLSGFKVDNVPWIYDSYTNATLEFADVSSIRHAIEKHLRKIRPDKIVTIDEQRNTVTNFLDSIVVWCDGRQCP